MERSNKQQGAVDTKPAARQSAGPASDSTAVRKKVRKVEDYEVLEPVNQSQPRTITIPAREVVPDEEEFVDPVEQFLAQIDEEQGYVLRIDRLPQFRKTGIYGRGAPREFQGELPFSVQSYMLDIQALYGPGDYLLTLKETNGQFVKKWVEHIGAPVVPATQSGSAQAGSPVPAAFAQAQPSATQRDSLDEFIQTAEKISKLRKALGWEAEPAKARQQIETPTAPPERPLEERIIEKLLGLAEKNEPLADRLLDKYLGTPESKEPGWMEIVGEIFKPLVPVLAQAIFAQSRLPGQQQLASQPLLQSPQQLPQTPMTTAPGVTAQAPEGVADSQQSNGEEDEPFMELIDTLVDMLEKCVRQAAADPAVIDAGYQEVKAFRQRNPLLAGVIQMLVTGTPELVLGMLIGGYPELTQLQGNKIVLDSITALQAKLRVDQ